LYDLAIIRAWAGQPEMALLALQKAVTLNPGLKKGAATDKDLSPLRGEADFSKIIK
jgi:hypothetical protein